MPTFPQLEFHRRGVGLVAAPGTSESAIHVEMEKARPMRSCTCGASKTCRHLKELSRLLAKLGRRPGEWEALFAATAWYRLARLVFEARPAAGADVRIAEVGGEDGSLLRVASAKGDELACYLDAGAARLRLLERLGKVPEKAVFTDRAALLERLALFQMAPQEREMNRLGYKTGRQSWEESLWFRLAYHCVREYEDGTFEPAIDEASGDFTLGFRAGSTPVCRLTVPRGRVEAALKLLARCYPDQPGLDVHPVPLRSLFRVTRTTELDLEVRHSIVALQEHGEERFFAREDLQRFTYGRLVYLPEMGILAQLEKLGKERRFKTPVAMRLTRSQVPTFLSEHREALADGTLVLDEPLRDLAIFTAHDWIEMTPEADAPEGALDRSWTWLSVRYGFGASSVSLRELLEARRQGLPYLETAAGWIDLSADAFAVLDQIEPAGEDALRLTASQVLRLQAEGGKPARVAGPQGRAGVLRRLLELRPSRPFTPPAGLASELRPYQALGVDWLRFLYENRLGGLLCDDMGLGKTHQAMALMLALREELDVADPFLVVCPTSVISHWRDKVRDHAPGLKAAVHHGPDRDLAAALAAGDVVVTSYGILRRDVDALRRQSFALAVFDEIQHLKNRDTVGFQAAQALAAEVRLGLTGTPIENSLAELKALFDLVLPGYLGGDEAFARRYVAPPEGGAPRLAELRRVISPFVLRRLKASVLDELPEKIEDLRTCALSDDQVRLYREALATRGEELAAEIAAGGDRPLPYIHVFALLNLLKRICDHPALALGRLDQAADYASGKWDLYRELLQECLDSGQKVVVFTQYLGMIELMRRHLGELGVEHAVLTGASLRRGEIVARFNADPDCRVFLGSLKAGGTGIDLVGGSVVIHYDRWWNAAREDQATDRVHRIGQRRAVQVFKLLTEGTLEEKIAAIIERKRELMEGVVEEDDPRLAKIFTREELLALLRAPVT
jgi:superfamily II DNA or RNA helicase